MTGAVVGVNGWDTPSARSERSLPLRTPNVASDRSVRSFKGENVEILGVVEARNLPVTVSSSIRTPSQVNPSSASESRVPCLTFESMIELRGIIPTLRILGPSLEGVEPSITRVRTRTKPLFLRVQILRVY